MPSRNYKRERTARGLCHSCSGRAIQGQTLCATCKAHTKTRYWQLVTDGVCVRCGWRPARADKRTCFPCGVTISVHHAQRYQREKAHGICHSCHRHKAYKGRSRCFQCYMRQQRRSA